MALFATSMNNKAIAARENGLGTAQELEQFLAGVERRAFRMAQFAVGNQEDALDLVQDAMFKLARQYAARAPQEWGPLFYRILQSGIRDAYRRSRVRNRWRVWFNIGDAEDDPLLNLPDTDSPGPEQRTVNGQAMNALEEALQRLPLRQQQVFLLRVWEGLDIAQTARAMGCTQGSVKIHYSRAVHSLRTLMEEHRV